MRTQIETFLVEADEDEFSRLLRLNHPTLFFIDYDLAQRPDVSLQTDLRRCPSGFAYVWDAATECPIEGSERWKSSVANKSVDTVGQFLRSRLITEDLVDGGAAHVLLSGRVAPCLTGKGTLEQNALNRILYKSLKQLTSSNVVRVSPTSRVRLEDNCPEFRIGPNAIDWCRHSSHVLRHVGTKTAYYLPASLARTAE